MTRSRSRWHTSLFFIDNAMAVKAFDVISRKAGKDRMNLAAGHQLGFFDGLFDGVDRAVDIDDDAFAQSLRRVGSDADNFHARSVISPTTAQTFEVYRYPNLLRCCASHDLVLSPTRNASLVYCRIRLTRATT